jgi:hypothetical protein
MINLPIVGKSLKHLAEWAEWAEWAHERTGIRAFVIRMTPEYSISTLTVSKSE